MGEFKKLGLLVLYFFVQPDKDESCTQFSPLIVSFWRTGYEIGELKVRCGEYNLLSLCSNIVIIYNNGHRSCIILSLFEVFDNQLCHNSQLP